jgi:hypothetical protein
MAQLMDTNSYQYALVEAIGNALTRDGEIRLRMCYVGRDFMFVNALANITRARVWSTAGTYAVIPFPPWVYSDPAGGVGRPRPWTPLVNPSR